MILTSKNNPLIKQTVALKDKKERKKQGLFLIEGKKMVKEALSSGLTVVRVFLSEEAEQEEYGVETVTVSKDVFSKLSDEKTPQGVLCVAKIPNQKLAPPSGACLILDGVSDPGNMGAIVRTANAAGYQELYLTTDCTDPYAPKAVRASMSGIFFIKTYVGERAEILSAMDGTPIWIADLDGENVFTACPPNKFALVIGNEANGVSREMKNSADKKITIPMARNQESLNAAVAAGVSMYLLKREVFSK